MKKCIIPITLASLALCGCQSLPPKNKSEWESTPVDRVRCDRIGEFGTAATPNYILGALNVGGGWWVLSMESAKLVPNPLIMAIGGLATIIGVTAISLADGIERDAILCEEFHQFKSGSQGLLHPPQKYHPYN